MSRKPMKPCKVPGCPGLTAGRYCSSHADYEKAVQAEYDRRRGTSSQRLYGWQWQLARAVYLADHPMCKRCRDLGIITAATVVDHIIPHRGDPRLFWDRSNWQSLCTPCHDGWKQAQERCAAADQATTGPGRAAGELGPRHGGVGQKSGDPAP